MVIDSLKQALRLKRLSYNEVATRIGVSEITIKRVFSEQEISFTRFSAICDACGINPWGIFESAQKSEDRKIEFSKEADQELASDDTLLLFLYLLLVRKSHAQICKKLKLSKSEFYRLARQLEKLELVEVLPRNKIKLLIPKTIRWSPQGELTKRYAGAIQKEFFKSDFSGADQHQDFLTLPLSPNSAELFTRKINQIYTELASVSALDSGTHDAEVYWVYSGIRRWEPLGVIEKVRSESGS
jgi:transcriptional regulator with XRE-family HTH domain